MRGLSIGRTVNRIGRLFSSQPKQGNGETGAQEVIPEFSAKASGGTDPEHQYLARGRWFGIMHARKDSPQQERELVVRMTQGKFFAGVNVFPIQLSAKEGEPHRLVLIENFRIPVWGAVLEEPAGLAEVGSTVEENGLREVREETGVENILKLVPRG